MMFKCNPFKDVLPIIYQISVKSLMSCPNKMVLQGIFVKDLPHRMDFSGIFHVINEKTNIKFEILQNNLVCLSTHIWKDRSYSFSPTNDFPATMRSFIHLFTQQIPTECWVQLTWVWILALTCTTWENLGTRLNQADPRISHLQEGVGLPSLQVCFEELMRHKECPAFSTVPIT